MFKRILIAVAAVFLSLLASIPVRAETPNPVTLYLFYSDSCPHCTKEEVFLEGIRDRYPALTIREYEVSKNYNNAMLLQRIGIIRQLETGGVPMTFIGEDMIVGFDTAQTTGQEIVAYIERYSAEGDPDPIGAIIRGERAPASPTSSPTSKNESLESVERVQPTIKLPFVGTVNPKDVSLPVFTILIALLDGFNPCAMWTLLFLISLLLGMKDRRRMWILGVAFIVTSAFVYFLFLSAWLNLFLFLGMAVWVRVLVGVLALAAGIYYLRDYWVNRSGACAVTGNQKRQRVFERIRKITQRREFYLAFLGIILLAFAVNMVELVCSAGLPAVYTRVLSMSSLPVWQYYAYLVLYILVFMLDDLFVFFTAMFTLRAVGLESKYARYSHLIGGIFMVIIGILMLVKPELLMFG